MWLNSFLLNMREREEPYASAKERVLLSLIREANRPMRLS